MLGKLGKVLACAVSACVLVTMLAAANNYVAKNKDLKLVEYRLNQKIIQDDYKFVQRRIWALEDRYGTNPAAMPPDIKRQYRELKMQLKDLARKIKGK